MKSPGLAELLNEVTTQADFAEIVGLSEAAVSQLVANQILVRGETCHEWILAYCDRLREVAAGRAADGGLDLATERALLAREQRVRIEMQNAVTRRELMLTVVLEKVLASTASKVAGILDAIPGMVRRRVPQLTADDIDLIAAEVAKARNTVAGMSLADVDEPDEAPELDDGADGGEDGAVEVDGMSDGVGV